MEEINNSEITFAQTYLHVNTGFSRKAVMLRVTLCKGCHTTKKTMKINVQEEYLEKHLM